MKRVLKRLGGFWLTALMSIVVIPFVAITTFFITTETLSAFAPPANQKPKIAEFIFPDYVMKFEYLETDDKSKDSIHYKDCGVITIHYPGAWGDIEKCEICAGESRAERKPTTLAVLFKTVKMVRYRVFPLDVFEDPNPKADKKWVLVNPRGEITGVNLVKVEK